MLKFEMIWDGELHSVDLEDGEHSVGRGADNAIRIPVASVSKQHAMIRVDGERLFVKDLGSTNGTDVDGQVVGSDEREVLPEHTIRFAGVAMWRSSEDRGGLPQFYQDGEVSSHVSIMASDGYSDAARTRIMDMLSGLFELLAADESAQVIGEKACEFVADWVKGDRVVLLEDDGEGTQLQTKCRWEAGNRTANDKLRLSSTIVGQVLKGRESVLVANAAADPNFSGNESIMALDLRSAMAVPLFDNQRVRGILYTDTVNPSVMYNTEDLQVLTATANAVAVKLRNISLESELKTAARIQQAMLPETLETPTGYELHAHLVMCRAVGGDLYHCLPRPDGKLLLVLGDVSGKGTPAALAMSAAIVCIRTLAELGGELDALVQHLHKQLYQSLAPEQFITMFLGELDPLTGEMHYVNAGHPPPMLIRADGSLEELPSGGLPVAMIDRLPIVSSHVTMMPGDLLAIFSDGVPEATKDGDVFLGEEPVKDWLISKRELDLAQISKHVVSEVDQFLDGDHNSDDLTLMLLRRTATADEAAAVSG